MNFIFYDVINKLQINLNQNNILRSTVLILKMQLNLI